MKLQGRQKIMRIYVDEQDKWRGQPLYEALVEKAWTLGLAGATAFRGVLGFGCKSHVQAAGSPDLAEHVPVCVEIVETPENLARMRPAVEEMVKEGLVVVEDVEIMLYRTEGAKA
jgi:PII-like signaling protein